MEDEVDDVVRALERDLPVLSHTPTTMLTGRRLVLISQTPGQTPRSVQDCTVESSDQVTYRWAWRRQSRPATIASLWQVRSVGGTKAGETVGVGRWQFWT